jgi:DNA-binding NarL/FixJ family response regulator
VSYPPVDSAGSVELPLRLVLVDDSTLFRTGLAALLAAARMNVVAQLSDPAALPAVIRETMPDIVVMDVRMPPTHTDEGIAAALRMRSTFPEVGVLVLSTYADGIWAQRLFVSGTAGLGYLLKDRVNDTAELISAVRRVSRGGTAIDPEVVDRLLQVTNRRSPLQTLSDREREVLNLMAQGKSNAGISAGLHLSLRTVEAYSASIFAKLPLNADQNTANRRVLAVLTYLNEQRSSS